MNVKEESYGHAVIFNLAGELTEDSLAVMRNHVDRHLLGREVVDLVFNLEKVPFLDSAALEYLLDLHDRLAERLGQVKLLKCDDNVRKILEITCLDRTFEIFRDIPEAVKALHG